MSCHVMSCHVLLGKKRSLQTCYCLKIFHALNGPPSIFCLHVHLGMMREQSLKSVS